MTRVSIIALILFLVSAPCIAQDPIVLQRARMVLLMNQDVVTEDLGLSQDIVEKIRSEISGIKFTFEGYPSNGRRFSEYYPDFVKLLTPPQNERLFGIWCQADDLYTVLNNERVVKSLSLDSEVRNKIKTVLEERRKASIQKMEEIRALIGQGNLKGVNVILRDERKRANQEVCKVLNKNQLDAWEKLQGKILDVDMTFAH